MNNGVLSGCSVSNSLFVNIETHLFLISLHFHPLIIALVPIASNEWGLGPLLQSFLGLFKDPYENSFTAQWTRPRPFVRLSSPSSDHWSNCTDGRILYYLHVYRSFVDDVIRSSVRVILCRYGSYSHVHLHTVPQRVPSGDRRVNYRLRATSRTMIN